MSNNKFISLKEKNAKIDRDYDNDKKIMFDVMSKKSKIDLNSLQKYKNEHNSINEYGINIFSEGKHEYNVNCTGHFSGQMSRNSTTTKQINGISYGCTLI